ncbi:MAG: DUF3147 family protein [Akkermansiaceae bacterium]|nr:DUF3147 family protein [Akkermansiaceae bacterium]
MDKNELIKVLTPNLHDVVKILLTAVIILVVTKLQLLSDRLSALLIALPLTSILAMIWMRHESKVPDQVTRIESIANHAYYTFWFVLPTMPMFLVIPWMLRKGHGFYFTLFVNAALTTALFWLLVVTLKKFTSIELM